MHIVLDYLWFSGKYHTIYCPQDIHIPRKDSIQYLGCPQASGSAQQDSRAHKGKEAVRPVLRRHPILYQDYPPQVRRSLVQASALGLALGPASVQALAQEVQASVPALGQGAPASALEVDQEEADPGLEALALGLAVQEEELGALAPVRAEELEALAPAPALEVQEEELGPQVAVVQGAVLEAQEVVLVAPAVAAAAQEVAEAVPVAVVVPELVVAEEPAVAAVGAVHEFGNTQSLPH